MSLVTHDDIARGLRSAGLTQARAVVHSSLRSFGMVQRGATTVASALSEVLETVIVPTMLWDEGSAAVGPPPGELLDGNGVDAEFLASLPKLGIPFDPERSGISSSMGAVARAVRNLPGAIRSRHPLCSWAAVGADAIDYVAAEQPDDPFFPLRKLYAERGSVVLLGVTLTSCTALHFAEQLAGRNPFIRWAKLEDGTVQRVRVGGCSDGFDRLLPPLSNVIRQYRIGECRVLCARLDELVDRATEIIVADPEITVCERRCLRCYDALAGGPK